MAAPPVHIVALTANTDAEDRQRLPRRGHVGPRQQADPAGAPLRVTGCGQQGQQKRAWRKSLGATGIEQAIVCDQQDTIPPSGVLRRRLPVKPPKAGRMH